MELVDEELVNDELVDESKKYGKLSKVKQRIFNSLCAVVLAFSSSLGSLSSCSSETIEENYICDNMGCYLLDEGNQPANQSKDYNSLINLETAISSSAGEAVVLGRKIKVVNEWQQPLPQIKVYGLSNQGNPLFLAVDPSAAHYPSALTERTATLESSLESSSRQGALSLEDTLTLALEKMEWGKKVMATLLSTEGDFLGEGKSVNYYCMTVQQMKNNYLFIPAGILVLSSPDGFSSQILKIVKGLAANEIFNKFIRSFYGEQEGYLIAVPKTATNLCGSSQEAVCSLTTEGLSQELWSKQGIPFWEIRGTCFPQKVSSSPSPPENDYSPSPSSSSSDHSSTPSPSSQKDNGKEVWKDGITGLLWEKNASADTMTRKAAIAFCSSQETGGYQGWRLPFREEVQSIMEWEGSCHLPSALNGPCSYYWVKDDTCVYVSEPYLRADFSSEIPFECVSKGVEAYVRCVKD